MWSFRRLEDPHFKLQLLHHVHDYAVDFLDLLSFATSIDNAETDVTQDNYSDYDFFLQVGCCSSYLNYSSYFIYNHSV